MTSVCVSTGLVYDGVCARRGRAVCGSVSMVKPEKPVLGFDSSYFSTSLPMTACRYVALWFLCVRLLR